jgi:hypothetical protein
MGFILRIIKKTIASFILLLVLSYFIVPPIANLFVDDVYTNGLSTKMLKSDQPKSLSFSDDDKILHRALNIDTYLSILGSTIWHLPSVAFNYLMIKQKHPKVLNQSFGVFVDASKAPINRIMQNLDELNITSTAIRIYVTKEYVQSDNYRQNLLLAKKLHDSGRSIMLVLAQLYETFSPNLYWTLNKITSDFSDYVDYYQAGEAINRDKWGVLNKDRFRRYILSIYQNLSLNDPEAKIVGPAVIDFEWYYTIYYLNMAEDFIDIQGTLLYVDRVKEPENEQYGFDTIKKVRLLKAIKPDKPLWITEVNWPIRGTGEFRPTSKKEAVSIEDYRNYMIRYLIQVLADGQVKRVYWWQLHARGYGLIDHTNGKKYPAFDAYKKLITLLSGSKLTKIEVKDSKYSYQFKKGEAIFTILWQKDGKTPIKAPIFLKCISFDDEIKGYTSLIGSTPIVCGDKLSLEYIDKVIRK